MASLFAPGLASIRKSWRPFVAIQILAVGLAVVFYSSPAVQEAAGGIAAAKAQGGLIAAGLASAFAGLILPEAAKRLTLRHLPPTTGKEFAHGFVLFAGLGVYVDLLYGFLGGWLGTGTHFSLVATKVALDMGVSTPVATIPFTVFMMLVKDHGYSVARAGEAARSGAFWQRYPSTLVTAWALWVPVVCAVYAMPANLQFALFLCAQAAWSLLLLGMRHD